MKHLLDGMVHVLQHVLLKVFASIHPFQVFPEFLQVEVKRATVRKSIRFTKISSGT